MSDTNFPISADDDLPRSFRRARQEQDAGLSPQFSEPAGYQRDPSAGGYGIGEPSQVTVRALKIPFVRLVFFFIKAVFAAIPAFIILGALLWGAGELLTGYFPELIKMRINISFPN